MTALLDPRQLTKAQRRAMELIAAHRLYRGRNAWGHTATAGRITLERMTDLQSLGLASIDRTSGRAPFPVLTQTGKTTLAVLEQRRARG